MKKYCLFILFLIPFSSHSQIMYTSPMRFDSLMFASKHKLIDAIGDFNGDGLSDLIVEPDTLGAFYYHDSLEIYYNTGGGNPSTLMFCRVFRQP